MKKHLQNNRGIALITVILIISILVAVALELNRSSRADIYDAANLSDGIKLTCIAKSGFYGGMALLARTRTDYDSLRDDWAKTKGLSEWSKSLFPDGYFEVIIADESGKIPLNKLISLDGKEYNQDIKDILLRLLNQPEFGLDTNKAAAIVDAIRDWIDADEEVTGAGAENSYYASMDPPYPAKNAPLDCIDELLMIKGITKDLFTGTKDKPALTQYVSVYGEGLININTAPQLVLRSLAPNITSEMAQKMDEYRLQAGTDLGNPAWYLNVPGFAGVTIPPGVITTKSNYFSISSTGSMSNNFVQKISGVVKRNPGNKNIQIIGWRLE
jgi:general secretion pathway protein K